MPLGGESREMRQRSADNPDGMDKRKLIGVHLPFQGGFVHQAANRKVSHH